MTIILISHKLNEVTYVADKITIIRDGATIETLDAKKEKISEDRIIKGMVGRALADRFPKRPDTKLGDVCMEVKNWTVHHPIYAERQVVKDVSFHVRKGEVVGFYGLMGAGRTELAMERVMEVVSQARSLYMENQSLYIQYVMQLIINLHM